MTRLLFALAWIALCLAAPQARAQESALPQLPALDPASFAPQAAIDSAIDRGVTFLLTRQELDGSWKPDEHRYVAGQTGLSVYTLLKAGLPRTHPAVVRGIAFMRAHPPRWTYGIACCILALYTADRERYAEDIAAWTEVLLEGQSTGFSYPGSHEDLSLTQYGCLALRAAAGVGVEVPAKTWRELADFAFRVRRDDGSFTYTPGNRSTGSMTAAGVAVLQIVRDALDELGKLKRRERDRMDEAIEEGSAWLGANFAVDRNPDPTEENQRAGHITRWKLYYLYGLERVGGLTGRPQFGPYNWYGEASTFLVRTQGAEGAWGTAYGERHPGTCFGVLVLKRATAPTSGARPSAHARSYGVDDEEQDVSLRITGDTPLTMWVSSFGTAALEKHEWDGERGDGPRVVRVEYFDPKSEQIWATAAGNADQPARGKRFAARVTMERPGNYALAARVFVRPLDGASDEEVALVSKPIDVRVDAVMTQGMRDALDDFNRNVLHKVKCDVSASSSHRNHPAERASDDYAAYGWLCSADDAEPWIEFEPARPQRGDTLSLTPYFSDPKNRAAWGQPTKVRVRLNGKKFGDFDIDPDHFGPTRVSLGKRRTLRTVKIEILERRKGTHPADGVLAGFAEVALQLRGR